MKKIMDFFFSQKGIGILAMLLVVFYGVMLIASVHVVNGIVSYFKDRKDQPIVEFVVKVEQVQEASPSASIEPTPEPTVEPQKQPEVLAATTITGSFDVGVIGKINEYRVANGLNTLNATPKLNQTAQCRINYLIDTGTWSHANFGKCFVANGVRKHYGENLARQWDNSDQAVQAWKQSPSHNANLLNPNWKYVGVISDRGYTVATFSTRP